MNEVSIELGAPVVLYDPREVSRFGLSGEEEAKAIAKRRSIPLENVLPLPSENEKSKLGIIHNGYVIVVAHGNESTKFTTVTIRKKIERVNAKKLVELLGRDGLFRDSDLPYRFELIVCGAASGKFTFARALYDELRGADLKDVMVKAPVGFASVDAGGGLSVTYVGPGCSQVPYAMGRTVLWAPLQLARMISNRFTTVPDTFVTRYNLFLHDWFFYPIGKSF